MTEPSRTVRIRQATYDRVETEATARGLPPAWLADRLLAEALDHLTSADQFRLTRTPEPQETPT